MPKINSQGQPSYTGVSGQVTNAVGDQFELDPNKNLDGTEAEHAQPEEDRIPVVPLDGPDQLTPSANTDAAEQAERDRDADSDSDDEDEQDEDGKKAGDEWDPAAPKPAGNQTPAFEPKKGSPVKKATPATKSTATDKQ